MTGPVQIKTVTIFGAGVAGLTAAHELAVRGFRVEVWEPAFDAMTHASDDCAVGGMARTQFTAINAPLPGQGAPRMQRTVGIAALDDWVLFSAGSSTLDEAACDAIGTIADKLLSPALMPFSIEVHGWPGADRKRDLAQARADAVREVLSKKGVSEERLGPYAYADDYLASKEDRVDFALRQTVLPGEHGFRFFPAFYRHVFDSMRRTPIMTSTPLPADEAFRRAAFERVYKRSRGDRRPPDARYVETDRTAFDNLVPTTSQALAFDDEVADADVIPRRRTFSIDALSQALHVFLAKMGFTIEDIGKIYLKVMKYMTSCTARRERVYEEQSWWDFIDGDSLSKTGQARIDAWPRALVAMSAREADARTQGNIIVQLLIDQIVERDYTDGTLNGPTSDAWLGPWRTFLEQSQGVRFLRGKLTGFAYDGRKLVPSVEPDNDIDDGYIVVALPLLDAQVIAKDLAEKLPTSPTLQRIRDFPTGEVKQSRPTGPLQHMVGIQFYFEEDVQWVDGHVYFPDSEWGLTAISQAKFWQRRHDLRDGYYGTLSVCITDLHSSGQAGQGKCAWDLAPDDIAKEVWRQISVALSGKVDVRQGEFLMPRGGLPTPLAYHLDENLVGDPGPDRENLSPLLVNAPGAWKNRPGSADDGYELIADRLVFAGTYMQTHTRLTTMEAANESARHAVNAILMAHADGAARGNLCSLWDPEDNEIDDLVFLKDLDERLHARGLPHFMDILGWDSPAGVAVAGVERVLAALQGGVSGPAARQIIDIVRRLAGGGP